MKAKLNSMRFVMPSSRSPRGTSSNWPMQEGQRCSTSEWTQTKATQELFKRVADRLAATIWWNAYLLVGLTDEHVSMQGTIL